MHINKVNDKNKKYLVSFSGAWGVCVKSFLGNDTEVESCFSTCTIIRETLDSISSISNMMNNENLSD